MLEYENIEWQNRAKIPVVFPNLFQFLLTQLLNNVKAAKFRPWEGLHCWLNCLSLSFLFRVYSMTTYPQWVQLKWSGW